MAPSADGRTPIDRGGFPWGELPDRLLPLRPPDTLAMPEANGQELALELLRRTRRDGLDGERIHRDLCEARDAWLSALFWSKPEVVTDLRRNTLSRIDGGYAVLGGLERGEWRADHLWLVARDAAAEVRLRTLAETWSPAELVRHTASGQPLGQPPAHAIELVFPLGSSAPPPPGPTLDGASAQDICLEMIARTRYNELHGPTVARDLADRRVPWRAACMGRIWHTFVAKGAPPSVMPSAWNVLLELPFNDWNQDTLAVLVDEDATEALEALATRQWRADSVEIFDAEDTHRLVGSASGSLAAHTRLVEVWWD